MKPKLLDLFCGAGGAAMGYHQAGFEVVGVDIKPQPRYPFTFIQGDALNPPVKLSAFDAIHASPPCQAFTALKTMWNSKEHEDLLTPTRKMLLDSGKLFVIENVSGAPIEKPLVLCGTMFGLRTSDGSGELRRHRLFDLNWFVGLIPECQHHALRVIPVYGSGGKVDLRSRHCIGSRYVRTVTVVGKSGGYSNRDNRPSFKLSERKTAMGIDWMTDAGLSQAIPPAYTKFIGEQLMKVL